MHYFVEEVQFDEGERFSKTAWSKARADISEILKELNYHSIDIPTHEGERKKESLTQRLFWHIRIRNEWNKRFASLKKGDVLVLQFPLLGHSIMMASVIKRLKNKGVKVIMLIHDLETIRFALSNKKKIDRNIRLKVEELSILKQANKIIFHNERMIEFAESMGISREKAVELEIFDYLGISKSLEDKDASRGQVVIAGNLSENKAGYIYKLPENVYFRLYGINYSEEEKDNIEYMGAYPPDDLLKKINGKYGLVWDGPSEETCEGIYGEYLRINNPHKTSLYLAAEIPVIIWEKAALAKYIVENGVGITVKNLNDLYGVLEKITDEEYLSMKLATQKISARLRSGYYTKEALKKCE